MQDATSLPRTAQASSSSSDVAGGSASSDSLQLRRTTTQDSLARESLSTEWTDEKHSLYLKSMEASFVNELYNSFDLLGWCSERENLPDSKIIGKKHASTQTSSGQFKVLRRGCWGKINFKRHEQQLEKEDGCNILLGNPWIRHFRSSCRHQVLAPSTLQENAAFGSLAVHASGKMRLTSSALADSLEKFPVGLSHLCCCDSVGSNIEVTDQNFMDDDFERDKNSSHTCNAKRMKTSVITSPCNDQVVPTGKFSETTSVTKNFSSAKREGPNGSTDYKSDNDD
ncbi:hypothetical protein NMG60_11016433 [Bertholletia excelsa]